MPVSNERPTVRKATRLLGFQTPIPDLSARPLRVKKAARTPLTSRPISATMYGPIFGGLVMTCVFVRGAQQAVERRQTEDPTASAGRTSEFSAFQLNYLLVYLLAVASDWLQGPYVYALYTEYGFEKKAIGQLFIAGFGSSAIFGTIIGSIADKFGRKFNVLVFVITYALSCATKHVNDFNVLLIGRIFAGIATSILFSAFESWLISEHNQRGHDPALLSDTFSKAQFGNAVVAIVAGQLAGIAASHFGKVAPFDMAAGCLLVLGGIVVATWGENYGDARQSVSSGMKSAWSMMLADEKILLVGIIQSAFESAMYLMVFSWTPALQSASQIMSFGEIPHGMIFSSFMVAIMIGSSAFTFLMRQQPPELFMRNLYAVGVGCFVVTALSTNLWYIFGSFLVFEFVCGVYFPAMGTMRAKYVPEETRAAIMNYFRVPLNVIVCATLYKNVSNERVFQLSAILLGLAVLCQQRLFSVSKASIGTDDDWTLEEREELAESGTVNVEEHTK